MRIVTEIDSSDLLPLMDKEWLFGGLWRLKGRMGEGEKILKEFSERISGMKLEPKLVYDFFGLECDGDKLRLYSEDGGLLASFSIVNDIFVKMGKRHPDFEKVALVCATVGGGIIEVSGDRFGRGEYTEYFYISGLAAALAEAVLEYGHFEICRQLGCERKESFRISPGYPVWPSLSDQKVIAKLLPLHRIGVCVSETNQLVPEFSVTALVFCSRRVEHI